MYKRILVPVDGSELSDRAIHASVDLARQLGASITGFVAEPLPPVVSGPRPHLRLVEDEQEHEAMTAAHAGEVLQRFEAYARENGVPFDGYHDQVPRVDQAIIEAAA